LSLKKENLSATFEKLVMNVKEINATDAINFAWYFVIKANFNQELWNKIIGHIAQIKSLSNISEQQ